MRKMLSLSPTFSTGIVSSQQHFELITDACSVIFYKFNLPSEPFCRLNERSRTCTVLYLNIPNKCSILYNNPSYSRILIGSRLWSIRGQMHDWRHHCKVFPSAVLKWRKVLRIRIIFHVTGQKIRYKKVLPRHWTGSTSQKMKDKAVSYRKW